MDSDKFVHAYAHFIFIFFDTSKKNMYIRMGRM